MLLVSFLCLVSLFVGFEMGVLGKREIHETLTFLIESDRNIETVLNIKALEGLRGQRDEIVLELMEVRVKAALKMEGISDATKEKAVAYQKEYCLESCLGM